MGETGVLSENSIRLGIRIVGQNHPMIGPMLALLYSLGMFIVDLFKSRRRARTMVQISLELGGDHAVQDNRNTAAQRGGCRF